MKVQTNNKMDAIETRMRCERLANNCHVAMCRAIDAAKDGKDFNEHLAEADKCRERLNGMLESLKGMP